MGDIGEIYGGQGFDSGSVEPSSGDDFAPLPVGWYDVMIDKAEVVPNSKKNGKLLKIEMVVVSEKFGGRRIFDNINLSNPSQECVEIGQRSLAGLGQATGIPVLNDSHELLDKVVSVKLKIKLASKCGTYPAGNAITAYRACGYPHLQQPQPTQQEQPQAQPQVNQQPQVPIQQRSQQQPWKRG